MEAGLAGREGWACQRWRHCLARLTPQAKATGGARIIYIASPSPRPSDASSSMPRSPHTLGTLFNTKDSTPKVDSQQLFRFSLKCIEPRGPH
ncbi:hypothetical protein V6N12_050189 [Hibiscus sabdariffa]|uniref:Uncharacterized protein n=1 Tax=Hibiscus sabdariffa TaxID=183260 RepID=A0ABR2GBT4_9ROSI